MCYLLYMINHNCSVNDLYVVLYDPVSYWITISLQESCYEYLMDDKLLTQVAS